MLLSISIQICILFQLGTGHNVLGGGGGGAGRSKGWVISFQAKEKGWITLIFAPLKLGILSVSRISDWLTYI